MSTITQRTLAAALKELMQTKPLDKIKVKDLTNACQLNRQTFYYHFHDIYHLLGWIYKEEALAAIKDCKTYDTWQQGLLIIFTYVEQNKVFCLNTYRSLGREHLESFLFDIIFVLLNDVLEELSVGYTINRDHTTFIAHFYSYALASILLEWLRDGMKMPYRAIIDNLNRLLKGDFINAIQKFSMEP